MHTFINTIFTRCLHLTALPLPFTPRLHPVWTITFLSFLLLNCLHKFHFHSLHRSHRPCSSVTSLALCITSVSRFCFSPLRPFITSVLAYLHSSIICLRGDTGTRAFSRSAPNFGNSILEGLHNTDSLCTFKSCLKTVYLV